MSLFSINEMKQVIIGQFVAFKLLPSRQEKGCISQIAAHILS